jgi:hypothetical protein
MHQKLLADVIKRQSGTLTKSVTEGVMNSIEAGASFVAIDITSATLKIADDGRGFTSKEEVENCFELFGAPHKEGEGKIWAQFRIGRGQLFAFGRNRWRTGSFQMDVDIEGESAGGDGDYGIGYHLTESLPEVKGCQIEIALYEKLDEGSIRRIEREVADFVKYVTTRVSVNGKDISLTPGKEKWDIETDDCYLKFSQSGGGLLVYNLGIYVMTSWNLGVSGIVVSKKRLDVNFARNEIISSCPVWRRIKKTVASNVNTSLLKKSRLDEAERRHIITNIVDGVYGGADVSRSPLFPDVTGRYWSAGQLSKRFWGKHWSVAEEGSRSGDRVIQLGLGIVFDRKLIDMFHTYKGNMSGFFDFLNSQHGMRTELSSANYRDVAVILQGISEKYVLLKDEEITRKEQLILKAATKRMHSLVEYRSWENARRKLCVGVSDIADGWTNGSSYIAINRNFLRRIKADKEASCEELSFLLLHELLHTEADTISHVHGPEFYKSYHDLTINAIRTGTYIFAEYRSLVKKEEKSSVDLIAKEKAIDEAPEREKGGLPVAARTACTCNCKCGGKRDRATGPRDALTVPLFCSEKGRDEKVAV